MDTLARAMPGVAELLQGNRALLGVAIDDEFKSCWHRD